MNRPNPTRDVYSGIIERGFGSLWKMLLLCSVLCSANVAAVAQSASEYQIKAAFLFNFAKFVEWPSNAFRDASAPLQICVFGQDPFGQELRDITNEKTVNGRKLEINHVVNPEEARSCQILFIPSSEKARLKQILQGLQGSEALTVSETKGFAEQGGMINFVLENNRVLFEVNSKAAEQAGLKISSKLLVVAKFVIV